MRRHSIIALSMCAAALVAAHPSRRETAVGHTWEYRGTVTVENIEGEHTVRYLHSLYVTATQANSTSTVRPPILRFRSAAPMGGSAGPPTPKNAIWIHTPGRYAGHLPTPYSLDYGLDMADSLPLPHPFRTALKPTTISTISLPLFSLQGDLVPLRQHVMGIETIAGRPCYRVDRTTTRNQPVGLGMLLGDYKETLWIDTTDSILAKYYGHARIAGPNSVMLITTALQREAVRPLEADELTQLEQQANLLSKAMSLLNNVPFRDREQSAHAQQLLEQFGKSYPDSPYRAAYDSMWEALDRETKVLDRTLQQADMAGKPAPAFDLSDLSGKTRNLTEFRGRVLLLNFFATWCGPCNEEAPQIEAQFWQKWRPRGLVVLGIDGQEEENALAKARGFRDRHKLTYSLLIDTESKAAAAYHVHAIPVNVVIDREGIVRYIATGFDSAALNAVLTPLLKP